MYFTKVCMWWILFRLIQVHVYLDYYQVGALDSSKQGLLKVPRQNSKIYLFSYKITFSNNPYPSELKKQHVDILIKTELNSFVSVISKIEIKSKTKIRYSEFDEFNKF